MFARTKRLTLRPGWPEDAPVLAQAIAHEDVAFKLSRLPWPYTEAHALEWLSTPKSESDVTLLIFAHEQPTPRLVGGIGLHETAPGGGIEIGYWLTPSAWGRGYATEAGHAVLGMAQHALGLRRLVGRHFLDNPASGKVLRKLGFRPNGVARMPCLARNGEFDCATLELDFDADESRMPIAA
ncbi:GNAT family N-acetyltransferase [Sphingomonas panacisoli]|uniref:GNAT family N-acetyltransferase n=1 Tax=Sphingomonas panacisoli TaxID=1813879 RepID=UPI001F016F6B|nr:GNAT family N-acetyltransferase [Sphingomonas panacisoli]